jgi:hypothetical protein
MLTLLAVVLMPFGMISAPAMARSTQADHSLATMGHCDEQQEQHKVPVSEKMDCTATCIALPATDVSSPAPRLMPVAPRSIAIFAPFIGIEPEIVTPPPRSA